MFKKIVYCSPIQGQLLLNGKPLAGIQVTRTLYSGGFAGDKNIDYATSDAQGRYQFPEVSERRLFRPDLLSANPHIGIGLELAYRGTLYNIWTHMKKDFEAKGSSQKGIQIFSELNQARDLGGVSAVDSKIIGATE